MKQFFAMMILLASVSSIAATDGNLENELNSLDVKDEVPQAVTKEKLYAIQARNSTLKNRLEILASAAQNFTSDGFLNSYQVGGELQFHFNDDWSVAGAYSQVMNTFRSSADRLLETEGILPDVDYAKSRMEGRVQYNLFYGKFRFTKDSVMYFDLYTSLGYAQSTLASGSSGGPVGDAGFAFWVGNWGSVHIGVKDYYYAEKRMLSQGSHHNIHGYIQAGYLL
jgi:outer membrane beta-barrel protein